MGIIIALTVIIGLVLLAIALIVIPSMISRSVSRINYNIAKYTLLPDGAISFAGKELGELKGHYSFQMPVPCVKPGDVLSVSYVASKGRLTGITEIFMNGKSVVAAKDGNTLSVSLKEILSE